MSERTAMNIQYQQIVETQDFASLRKDIEELKRGQEEILALLRDQTQPKAEMELQVFREMVRKGADPATALREVQRTRRDTALRVPCLKT